MVIRANKARELAARMVGMENAMRCDLCHAEVTNDFPLCQSCAEMIPPFTLPSAAAGTELALELATELAPYLVED